MSDHLHDRDEFERSAAWLVRDGALRSVHTTFDGGIEAAWPAFLGMLDGASTGKAVVALASDAHTTIGDTVTVGKEER